MVNLSYTVVISAFTLFQLKEPTTLPSPKVVLLENFARERGKHAESVSHLVFVGVLRMCSSEVQSDISTYFSYFEFDLLS